MKQPKQGKTAVGRMYRGVAHAGCVTRYANSGKHRTVNYDERISPLWGTGVTQSDDGLFPQALFSGNLQSQAGISDDFDDPEKDVCILVAHKTNAIDLKWRDFDQKTILE